MAYRDHRVPAANLIGEPGRVLTQILGVLEVGASTWRPGGGRGSRRLRRRARLRPATDPPRQTRRRTPAIQLKLADMATRLEAARLLTRSAAERKMAGLRCDVEAGMAKFFASETALEVATDSCGSTVASATPPRYRWSATTGMPAHGDRRRDQRDPEAGGSPEVCWPGPSTKAGPTEGRAPGRPIRAAPPRCAARAPAPAPPDRRRSRRNSPAR